MTHPQYETEMRPLSQYAYLYPIDDGDPHFVPVTEAPERPDDRLQRESIERQFMKLIGE